MRPGVLVVLAALFAQLAGCADWVGVRTSPPGAAVMIDGELIGISPVGRSMPRARLSDPPKYRVQLDGYRAVEGQFRTRIAPGRIVGAVFTAGILLIFRSPHYFEQVNVVLEPVNVPTLRDATQSGSTEERLLKLRQIYERGLLTDKEYERYRDEIIRGM